MYVSMVPRYPSLFVLLTRETLYRIFYFYYLSVFVFPFLVGHIGRTVPFVCANYGFDLSYLLSTANVYSYCFEINAMLGELAL